MTLYLIIYYIATMHGTHALYFLHFHEDLNDPCVRIDYSPYLCPYQEKGNDCNFSNAK